MRNIHLIPTDKPSRLLKQNNNKLILSKQIVYSHISKHLENINQNIYITNDVEIKEGEYCLTKTNEVIKFKKSYTQGFLYKKIILTTDVDLIKDGVQSIPDEFLEWFVKNPSCEEVKVYYDLFEFQKNSTQKKYIIIIPKEEPKQEKEVQLKDPNTYEYYKEVFMKSAGLLPKQETFNSKKGLKELQLKDPNTCENYKEVGCVKDVCDCYTLVSKEETLEEFIIREGYPIGSQQEIWEDGVRNGAKWQKEQDKNKYSEKDIEEYAEYCTSHVLTTQIGNPYLSIKEWFKKK